ncbi:hypothetical protein BCR41DRAFT_344390 [Lobosporangium transversale]|uniref:Uncharacterized protein n=1 Tax=Lobosporangium transversale TaxID=64571 RepID=A0A1Y2H4R9_9FUNG|nr:hypothetical protein BCR41DRAFT_344390 [Lobosporangium transversale]ORZ28994.1 hypothetical protein BCR41DRAFT_344390 [Lobosporangium transversale]|eukprot:XP_021886667.1 hypothetical protein BCR41DRAFT_344390 [Lobosporangium transversale]
MHLLHKLRRSISHRPRHLFDLPDEILCIILEYCCQDLDFLLWSCPLVTLENQFCHDCFHCTLCHGPVPRSPRKVNSREQRSHQQSYKPSRSTPPIEATQHLDTPKAQPEKPLDTPKLKKRRRRCHKRTACAGTIGSTHSTQCTKHEAHQVKPCPRNGNRPWCHHMEQQHSARMPLLWRFFSNSIAQSRYLQGLPWPRTVNFIHMPSLNRPFDHLTTVSSSVFNRVVYKLESLVSLLPYSVQHENDCDRETDNSFYMGLTPSESSGEPSFTNTTLAGTQLSTSSSTRFNSTLDNSLVRRRTMSLSARAPTLSNASMNRSWSITGTMHTSTFWRRDDRSGASCQPSDESDNNSESDETKDDFDASIHLAAPFKFLLVSRRFADAAVQSLWRNLVFHGHDTYQMQSLLSVLLMDDELPKDHRDPDNSLFLGCPELKELFEVGDGSEEMATLGGIKSQTNEPRSAFKSCDVAEMKSGPAAGCSNVFPKQGSNEPLSLWHMDEEHGAIQLNSPCRQSPKPHGHSGVSSLNGDTTAILASKELGNTSIFSNGKAISVADQGRHSLVEPDSTHERDYQWGTEHYERIRSSRSNTGRIRSNASRWSYRRYVRRVLLNFAHPQASPQMLVKALECLRLRCPDQIVALDLHANEKMRDAGLEKPEVLEQLFGLGLSKLRYLRLQGGFVDNQLLYALIKGLSTPKLTATGHSRPTTGQRYPSALPGPSKSVLTSPCRLSQVFLGPGSVTDSAVEKLIEAAGHSIEVFTVTSCVDVGGDALAALLTRCPKLRVLGIHRSLARDRDLLKGLGIETEMDILAANAFSASSGDSINTEHNGANMATNNQPRMVRKTIIAPLERLEFGTTVLTNVGIAVILKSTCNTLKYLVLETQHFSEGLLTDVIMPFCSELRGLYFDDPEHLLKQQHQVQGLGFSAGRRGVPFPGRQFEFGRSRRTFHADSSRHYQHPPQPYRSPTNRHMTIDSTGRPGEAQNNTKVSAWLGETSTDEWVKYGDCALWTCAASPGVSFNNGGTDRGIYPRRQPLPLHHAYHNPSFMSSLGHAPAYNSVMHTASDNFAFAGDYDDVLERFQVSRRAVDNVLQILKFLESFMVMQMDFKIESQGLWEQKAMEREDDAWRQSMGFRILQLLYAILLLSPIFYGALRW